MSSKLKPGLKRQHFAHPLDLSGMQSLLSGIARTKIIEQQLAKLQKDVEDEFYLINLADNTKLSDKQGASLHRMASDVADRFSVRVPTVFLDRTSEVRSCALAGERPYLSFTSGLVDSFPETAMRAVIGHELGHIMCEHTFYRLMAENYQVFSQLAGCIPLLGPVVSFGIVFKLFDWYKKSELSADRAALLATGDITAVQDYILRIAGGSVKLGPELSLTEFGNQADEFQDLVRERRQQGVSRRLRFLLSSLMLQRALGSHPWPSIRFKAITMWAGTRQYAELLAGNYEVAAALGEASRKSDELVLALDLPTEDLFTHLDDLRNAATGAVSDLYKQVKAPLDWLTDDEDEGPDKKE
ncbi:MAG: M48 family metallopeptidase [bacterium]